MFEIPNSANMKKNKEEETELPFMNGSNGHGEMKNSKVCSRSNNIFKLLVLVVAGCFRSEVQCIIVYLHREVHFGWIFEKNSSEVCWFSRLTLVLTY